MALAPERAALLNNLGSALLLDGRNEEARSVLHDALVRNPDHLLARANLGRMDQATEATASVKRSPENAPAAPPSAQAASGANLQITPNLEPLQLRQAGSDAVWQATAEPVATVPATVAPAEAEAAVAVAAAAATTTHTHTRALAIPARAPVEVGVEIANGNGTPGMATWIRTLLAARGVTQRVVLSNVRPYDTATTTVRYRAGFTAAAQQIADHMPQHVEIAPGPGGALHADVRVVLGRDIRAIAIAATGQPGFSVAVASPRNEGSVNGIR